MILDIRIGWTSDNAGDAMVFHFDGPVNIKKRYRLFSIRFVFATHSTWQPMRDQHSRKNSSLGKGQRSAENMFRVTVTVTLNYVSGGSRGLVSSIAHLL